ncbi:MAG TPA: NAD(P)-dependent oxidoreductase [Terriglobales bacterium]|nr:NAD(P)-dependent oxidoreductase [Terriglobales bacterium]
MSRPRLIVCAGSALFGSFFSAEQRRRLSRRFDWLRDGARKISGLKNLSHAQGLITTWDSPSFSQDLLQLAPNLRIIAHCGGEVKARFARQLFKDLTITNAPAPMARATAEMGAALLLYCARNIDFYRGELRRRSNRIYQNLHLYGTNESIVGREVAMIGFGRIGRALVDLLRGFDLRWSVYDPYASKSLTRKYPAQFVGLPELLARGHLLVLTAALTEETRGILNRARLSRLPDGAAIINIARGGLIDLDALTSEVRRGRLHCALDVTDPQEPLPINHPLRRLPGAIVTPHVAAANHQVRHDIADVVMDDLENFFRGRGVRNRVTTEMLDRMT